LIQQYLTTGASTITVTVADRYEAVMATGDTTDYLVIKDKVEDNTTPDTTRD
jgi:hypothetical protein